METVPSELATGDQKLRRAVLFVVCAMTFAGMMTFRPDGTDNEVFNLYAGAKLGPQRLYDQEGFRQVAASLGATVRESRLYYCRMPYFAVFTKPLSWLPYKTAVISWRFVQLLAIAAAVFLWPGRKPASVMVALASLPVVCVFLWGQDVALVFLGVAASAALERRGHSFLAGIVFSLCLGKPHLVIFIPLAMLALKNWKFLGGATVGASSQLLLSFAVAPLDWPRQWLRVLANPDMNGVPEVMPGLRSLTQTRPGSALAILIVVALLIAIWNLARRRPIEEVIAYALAAGIIANLHSYLVDCILLIPMITLAVQSRRLPERIVGVLLATPFPYFALVFEIPLVVRAGILALIAMAFWQSRLAPPTATGTAAQSVKTA